MTRHPRTRTGWHRGTARAQAAPPWALAVLALALLAAAGATRPAVAAAAPAAGDSSRFFLEEDGRGVGWFSVRKTTDAQGRFTYVGSGDKTSVFKYKRFELVLDKDFTPISSFVRANATAAGASIEIGTTYTKGKVVTTAKVNGAKQPVPESEISGTTFVMPSSVWSAMAGLSDYLAKQDAAAFKGEFKGYDPLSTLGFSIKVAGLGTRTVPAGQQQADVRAFQLTYHIVPPRGRGQPQTVELILHQYPDGRLFGYESADGKRRAYPFPDDGQLPEAPVTFAEVPVRFAAGPDTLAGSLMLPKDDPAKPGPRPALVLVGGSGPTARDETVAGFAVFHTLAEKLAAAGYATLRYDDRGVDESQGDYTQADMNAFAADAAAAVAALRARPEVNGQRVGLLGHSEGAMLAPQIATLVQQQSGRPVWCAVLMAGSTERGGDIILEQQEHGLAQSDWSDEVKERKRQLQRQVYAFVEGKADWSTVIAQADSDEVAALEAQKPTIESPWFRSFLAYDAKPWLRQMGKPPVLVLHGELDTQIPVRHGAALRDSLKATGNDRVSYVPARGMNHLFQLAKTGEVAEYGELKPEFATGFVERIVAFLAMCERMK